ncbi:Translation initiation factor eIF2 subunit alpha [Gracilaria domingensis]|nr:Translation initiation factor eIF2 subunit alpha [Gracilaria domingensis]
MASKQVNLECRMYENEFPEPDDVVMVQVKEIQDMGGYVHLLEYNNCQGMIMLSELSRRRIRSVNKLLKVGRQEVAAVVRVDKEKGYIDLSKRRVAPEDISKIEEKWNKSRTVHSIVRHVAETVGTDVVHLYERWGWPLYRKYSHAYDGFRMAVNDPDSVLEGLDITEREREELLRNVRRRLMPQPIKLRADIEVTCYQYEGIDAIRAALKAGEATGDEKRPIKIKLVAPPLYVITTSSLQKKSGVDSLNKALEVVKMEISKRRGKFVLKVAPRTVSEKDDRMLASMMTDLENANKEVAGDDDSDSE